MTSIVSSQFNSPRAMMDSRISAAASAGSISTADQTALESALDNIDKSLASSDGKPTSGIKDRIDDLIQQQVDAGTLTTDQAKELQGFFAQGRGAADGPDGPGGPDGPDGVDGADGQETGVQGVGHHHHHAPPPSSASDDGSTGTTDTADATQQLDTLIAFLQQLRSSLSSSTYGSTSTSSTTSSSSDSSNSGLVVNAAA
ncbi:hypothetical protein [Sphingobium sp. Sx8-8]|uniref:hypothetical protein n=1 Tax=Sphingobium sp. Sx8-8 TaxID=2933617 RepID=UPI001F580BE5|nr:hypothetical protein [Sphingobium sp. Sx8-8]